MALVDRLLRPFGRAEEPPPPPQAQDRVRFGMADWVQSGAFSFGGSTYGLGSSAWPGSGEERIPTSFAGFTAAAFQQCGPVFSCILARQMVFAEGRFAFRTRERGGADRIFGTPALSLLENPWPGGTTGELLARMEQDASLAGNSFWVRRGDRLVRLRPDRVRIIIGQEDPAAPITSVDARLLGYTYLADEVAEPEMFLPDEVAHYSPIPDPLASYRGMSWLQSIVSDIDTDQELTNVKQTYFKRGAFPSGHFQVPPEADDTEIDRVADMIRNYFIGTDNAGRILITSAEWQPISHSMLDAEIRAIQAAGETRIAAAAGVPPIIAGFSEGLQAATYSNYSAARRRFADGTMRPLWRMAAASLANLIDVPSDAELIVDPSQVAALREDGEDLASILTKQSAAVNQLIMAGFAPDAAVAAVTAGDLRRLAGHHSGLASVQLQPLQAPKPALEAAADALDEPGTGDAA